MRSLHQYLMEVNTNTKRDFIKSEIDNVDKETVDRIYSIINSASPEAKQQIDSFMGSIGLTFIQDNILGIFERNDDLLKFIDYINGGKMIKFTDIVNRPSGNVFDIISGKTEFSRSTVQRLSREKSSSNGVQVGEYEFLLRLMVQNASETLTCKRGDVTADGIAVEVKSGKPRITSAKTKHAGTIRETLNNELSKRYGNKISPVGVERFNGRGGQKVYNKFFEDIYDEISNIDKNAKKSLSEIFTSMYISQWPENVAAYKDILESMVSKHLFSGNKVNVGAVANLAASIGLFCYACTENFDRFLVFNKTTGDFECINTQVKNKSLMEDIYDKFDSGRFHITILQNELDNLQGKGIQFTLK